MITKKKLKKLSQTWEVHHVYKKQASKQSQETKK